MVAALWVLLFWVLVEICFYIYIHMFLLPSLQNCRKKNSDDVSPALITEKFCNIIDSLHIYSFEEFVSGWFLSAKYEKSKMEDVCLANIDSWLAWIVFDSTWKDLTPAQCNIILNIRSNWNGVKMLKERVDNYESIRHANYSLVPIQHMHHPLLMYVMFGCCVHWGLLTCLYSNGYHYLQTEAGMTYWYRQGIPRVDVPPQPPLLIFHGINAMGWSQYATLIEAFGDNRTLILVNCDAMREMVDAINANEGGEVTF